MVKAHHIQLVNPKEDYAMYVAFASEHRQCVDQHFGSCTSLLIYGVNPTDSALLEVCQFEIPTAGHSDNKLLKRMDVIQQCAVLYCIACGPTAQDQLQDLGIRTWCVNSGTRINSLLNKLQKQLERGHVLGLLKPLNINQGDTNERLNDLLDESW